jgi:hypothetical protein
VKKIALGVVVVMAIAGGALGWTWRQATALPDWYTDGANETPQRLEIAEFEGSDDSAAPLQWTVVPDRSPAPTEGPGVEPPPPEKRRAVMRGFHMRTHVENPEVRKAFKASRASFEDDRLEAGVVVNLSKIHKEKLGRKDRSFFHKVAKAFPSVAKRDVYVGLEDKPRVGADGILKLGPAPKIRVGNLNYSLKSVAKRLGTDVRSVRRDINRELRRMKVRDPAFAGPPG